VPSCNRERDCSPHESTTHSYTSKSSAHKNRLRDCSVIGRPSANRTSLTWGAVESDVLGIEGPEDTGEGRRSITSQALDKSGFGNCLIFQSGRLTSFVPSCNREDTILSTRARRTHTRTSLDRTNIGRAAVQSSAGHLQTGSPYLGHQSNPTALGSTAPKTPGKAAGAPPLEHQISLDIELFGFHIGPIDIVRAELQP
jgi:hypothetical protein